MTTGAWQTMAEVLLKLLDDIEFSKQPNVAVVLLGFEVPFLRLPLNSEICS